MQGKSSHLGQLINMKSNHRPDLPNHAIYMFVAILVVAIIIALSPLIEHKPTSVNAQWAALSGTIALLAPALFSLFKRSGLSENPPLWFVMHVVCACVGVLFILFHAAGGDWLSPPGVVLMLMLFLVMQGAVLRISVSSRFSHLFARSAVAGGFGPARPINKQQLQALIERKQQLLSKLDSSASEAVFSPNLGHWLCRPLLTLRYQKLIAGEARMIGARASAGYWLAWSRRIHMIAAALFFIGLIAHVIVVLFFAGYAAGEGEIDWWYITDWGR